VQPRWSGRWTTIGNLDSAARGQVDPAGLVTIAGAAWSLDWWIGAEDRWHLPAREVAVRQSLVGSSPVVETRLRVPSGDAVQRAYAARSASGDEALVVEVENQSKIPFAVAFAVRPHDQSAVGRIDTVEVRGAEVLVDGRPAIVLPRSPGRVAVSNAAAGDAATVVLAGAADQRPPAGIACPDGLAQAVLLFPLAHTATLRVVLPLTRGAEVEPGAFPDASQVASGWGTHASTGARVEVPDRRLRDAVAACTRHLLLEPSGPEAALALDLLGFPDAASRALGSDAVALVRGAPSTTLRAVVRHWDLGGDAATARNMVSVVATLAPEVARSGDAGARELLEQAAALLDAAGEGRAAADARALAERVAPGGPAPDPASTRIAALLADGTGTWSWPGPGTGHDPAANARLVAAVRELLLLDEADGLVLCPDVPPSWLGQGWELHGAPTRYGTFSYAVRWHGERPALLWELLPRSEAPVRLSAPGLDRSWSTTDPVGEALLSPVAIREKGSRRGLTIPVTIDSSPRRPA
jgi:hypothetical protein